ncbi:uncharacterized protein LOC8276341 isoform X1 [Ricinus communis]|uniref:uncharacterized protein LOC8276341 isoform X1 n=1 Tax=Ricinus communis TaxID=3988 RepID=UPI00201B2D78|nr:uncharacterized protein LOC8276341 isoform X1 [Ricinus communis]
MGLRLRRGNIVWARVQYPRKWWPGLVLSIKGHWVAVSFFNDIEDGPCYFLETEVCSFQENFESLVKTIQNCSKGEKLLDFALKLISRRVYSSLKCSCHFFTPRKNRDVLKKDLFESNLVLGFVLDVAVSPFIGVSDLVYAVTLAAKINAFRSYVVGACSVARNSDVSELEFAPLNEDQPNRRSWIEIKETKTQSVYEMLIILRCLALDAKYLSRECLNTVKQNVLKFRNLAYQNSLIPIVKKCSYSSISHPRCEKTQTMVKVDKNYCKDVFASLEPYVASSIKFLGWKRQVNHPADSGSSLEPYVASSIKFLGWKRQVDHPADSGSSLEPYVASSIKFLGWKRQIDCPDDSGSSLEPYVASSIKFLGWKRQIDHPVDSGSSLEPYVASSIKFLGWKRQAEHPVDSGYSFKLCKTMRLFSTNGADVSLDKGKTASDLWISDALISKPVFSDLSLKFRNTTPFAFCNGTDAYLHVKRTGYEANTFDAFSSVSKLELVMIHDANAGTRNYLPSPDTADQVQMEPSSGDYKTSVDTNGQVSINAAFRDGSMGIKKLHSFVTSDASFKLKVVQQSAIGALSDYQYLHMKFPRDFSLPSQKDFIRKFSRFGKVDSLRTKIFTRLGSAQVVFLHHLDAVTAYQYLKRKKNLFGEAKILFWLDPYEKKRRGSKFVVSLPNLKSCLKKSDRKHGQEDKKHTKKVRFLMET